MLIAALPKNEMLGKELGDKGLLTDTSIITQNTTLSGRSQWSDYGNSNLFKDIKTAVLQARAASFKAPNTITFSQDVWLQLVDHPDFLDRIKWSNLGVVTEADFLRLFAPYGIARVLVGRRCVTAPSKVRRPSLARSGART
ncbi:hypothetical protein [Williamsia sp. DF01-3]|uniref:hypothetical protein n=1 Tax=Williamsia sp. DF01-3 TaxID=2934157 RepID=UPI001FF6BE02|nr:hypothetical protein [Williamsia sp. DF01-3]MCK0519319.1 hypothetical protein [Williamsia sp. DF01-3]